MNTETTPTRIDRPDVWADYTPAELARLHEQARVRAHQLRDEAIAEFWRDAGNLWVSAIDHSRRAADRLAARLRQHARQRAAASRAFEA